MERGTQPTINVNLTRQQSNASTTATEVVNDSDTEVETDTDTLIDDRSPRTPPATPPALQRQNAVTPAFLEPPPVIRPTRPRTTVITQPIPFPGANRNNRFREWLDDDRFDIEPPAQRRRMEFGTPQRVTGRAFEIHNYSDEIQQNPLITYYTEITNIPITKYNEDSKSYFYDKINEMINNNPRYNDDEKQEKRDKLEVVYRRLSTYGSQTAKENIIAGYSIDYASQQDPVFQQQYIDSYLTDCTEAYGRNGMSCVKGTFERIYTSIPKTIEQRLTETTIDGHTLSDEKINEYKKLYFLYEGVPDDFLFPTAREWLEMPNMPANIEDRKRSLRDYIVQRVREVYNYDIQPDDASDKKINEKLLNNAYVLDALGQEQPEFGGRRSRKSRRSRKRMNKLGKKRTKKHKKARKTRKHKRARTKTKSNRS